MAEVVQLKQPISDTEADRQRFEAWANVNLRADEASSLLARSKGGDYVLATARGAWAAWQARGLGIIATGKSNLAHPRDRVLAIEAAAQTISEHSGGDAADGTMMLLTAAVHVAMRHSDKPASELLDTLANSLGYASVAADQFWPGK